MGQYSLEEKKKLGTSKSLRTNQSLRKLFKFFFMKQGPSFKQLRKKYFKQAIFSLA